jgi:hypothetical protein
MKAGPSKTTAQFKTHESTISKHESLILLLASKKASNHAETVQQWTFLSIINNLQPLIPHQKTAQNPRKTHTESQQNCEPV